MAALYLLFAFAVSDFLWSVHNYGSLVIVQTFEDKKIRLLVLGQNPECSDCLLRSLEP